MPKLSYKTKGNSSPQGKPRVYFCCHPEDFEKYFDSVYEEITKEQNCAFYYDSEPDGEITEEWLSYLGEMQLFVIPVTTKFLTKENKGLSVEFPFAEEKHIPVLPLMQENGLDDIFSLKMGSLQYLNKYDTDKTGISYEEKLDKYLKSVLVGDELAQQIRDAFDAYIFLSYRKKDRVYAQQLMRLIHENEFCRDVAIWYDEFLTPGENFNASIEEALRKSRLFALAVTPNLINEENYVMSVEYPMAKDAGKKILPAEVVKTDRDELEKKYEGIPACADAHNAPELSSALLNALSGIAVRENDGDPKHNFFIGLAYLSGIDVEVNHERALGLITSSAEAGLTEAMEKLVSMYRNGEGVARNYETAIEWQEKLVEVRRTKWENNPSEYNACVLCSKLWDCGDYYTEMHKYAESLRVYRELNSVSSGALEAFKSSKKLRRYLSVSYERLGNIYMAEGGLTEAKEMYLKFLELSKAIFEETGTVKSRRDLSVSYDKLGDIYKSEGRLSEAKEMYLKSLELSKAIYEETGTVESRRDLSVSYNNLGDIYKSEGRLSEAKEMYLKSLELSKAIYEETGTVELRRALSVRYNRLGGIYEAEGRISEAKEMYLKSLELSKAIYEETGTVESRRVLSVSYEKLGDIYEAAVRLSEAKEMYLKSLELRKAIYEETGTVESRRDLSVSNSNLGYIYKSEGRLSEAKEMYLKGLELRKAIFEETGTVESRRDLSISYNNLGDIYKSEGRLSEAKEMYLKGLELRKAIFEETGTVESRRDLCVSYEKLGDIYESEGRLSEAKEMYLKGLELSKAIFEETGTVESRRDLYASYGRLGNMYMAACRVFKAKEMYLKGLELSKAIFEETRTLGSFNDMAVSYYNLALLLNDKQYYQQAFKIWDCLSQARPDVAEYKRRRDIIADILSDWSKQRNSIRNPLSFLKRFSKKQER